jgi:hypothetical protein
VPIVEAGLRVAAGRSPTFAFVFIARLLPRLGASRWLNPVAPEPQLRPVAGTNAPVTPDARSDSRKAIRAATSVGVTQRA